MITDAVTGAYVRITVGQGNEGAEMRSRFQDGSEKRPIRLK